MFCNKCGAENPADGAFCQKCGASLKAAAAKAAPAKAADVDTTPRPGVGDMLKALQIPGLLMYGALTALVIALLIGILDATDSYDASEFFKALLQGVLVAGVLAGLSALITSRKA
ncbi:MAG: zinc ribbon domain-containing protein [Chloroflexi bacterium]|nr:zinc ribbon domain-containing protein [Chloroflexota bacterium]